MRATRALLLLFTPALPVSASAGELSFALHEVDRPGGRAYGQTSLADVDGDGDLDFISGRRDGDVWWFEYRGPDDWRRHRIGGPAQTDVGGVAFDVGGDGLVDQLSGATLFLHPGTNKVRNEPWQRFPDVAMSSHDHRVADIDGDGRLDLVAMSDRRGVFWYKIPSDPTQKWIEHRIGPARHSGLALGDVDGDGDVDVVRADWWFENASGNGSHWVAHKNIPFPGRRYNAAGMATQTRLADLDGDGDLDVAMTDGETDGASAMWFANDGQGRAWKAVTLATGLGALHSLALADFDQDGDLDIFTCEFHIGGAKRWFIFENVDPRAATFVRRTILEGAEGHESVVGDVDGDGDLDICSKPWNGDRHVYLENLVGNGFVSLFDGKTLDGWQGAAQHWAARDGRLIYKATKQARSSRDLLGLKLMTIKPYSDFVLRFEFKLQRHANNGVAVRAPLEGDPAFVGMEIQIIDNPGWENLKPYQYHGSIYGVVPAERGHLKPVGEWNFQQILCHGRRVRVTLNGAVIVDADLDEIGEKTIDGAKHPGLKRDQGYIGLLGHTARVEFRNIRIKELTD